MGTSPRLTFVPGRPTPAAGQFAWWIPSDLDIHDALRSSAPLAEVAGAHLPGGLNLTRQPDSEADFLDAAWQRLFGRVVASSPGELSVAGVDGPVTTSARFLPLLPVVGALAMTSGDVTESAPGDSMRRHSDVGVAHPSVVAWGIAAKWALEVVAAGRIVPAMSSADDPRHGVAWWRASLVGDDRLDALADALPVEAFATVGDNGVIWTSRDLLVAFCDAVADACGRLGRRPTVDRRRRAVHASFEGRFVAALTGTDPVVEFSQGSAVDRVHDLDEWAAATISDVSARAIDAPVRLVMSVIPPSQESSDRQWKARFGLATEDGRTAVDAGDVWAAMGTVQVGEHRVAAAGDLLVRWLALAGRLFPAVGRCLDDAEPQEVDITAAEAAGLIDGPAALRAAGVLIDVPSALRGAGIERARLVARIGRHDGQEATGTPDGDDGRLSLAALTRASVVAAVGDQVLAPSEFADLIAGGAGMVRWRGRWVRVESELITAEPMIGQDVAMSLTEALAAALGGRHVVDGFGWIETSPVGDVAAAVERLRAAETPSEVSDDDLMGFEGSLRPYQRRGVAWLRALTDLGMGAVLADEMGLGKTVEAIALLSTLPRPGRHLVVCPTSVVGNWTRELARFAPDMKVVRHHGPERATRPDSLAGADVIVTTYALLRRDASLLRRVDWDVAVFDEAQQVKNARSQTAQAARSLSCRVRIAMTGTPLENRLADLWSIVDLTNPGMLGGRRSFDERFAVPVERWRDEAAAERLRRLVAPFLLRRRKSDPEVAVDLPPKTEIEVACLLTSEQASLYQAVIDETLAGRLTGSTFERRGRILALLTALKQICDHPSLYLRDGGRINGRSGKIDRATEILGEIIDSDGHALVFTQYRRMGTMLVEHLRDELGLDEVAFLHGGVSASGRDRLVDRFQAGDTTPIMVVSLRAGGTGLNLTKANHVLHLDRWWNPAVEDQATDRAHRIGQTRSVTVHTMMTTGTLEERIGAMLARKRELADAIVGAGEAWITELSDDEIRDLVRLSSDAVIDVDDEIDDSEATDHRNAEVRPKLIALPGGRQ
ncbi:MAG: SNF2-related protein [Nitriliruptoraceae bacterium]